MQKLYKGWFWLSILAIGFLAGCAYAGAKSEKIPNLGLLKTISWESQEDPNSNGGYIQKLIVRDTERNHDYIVIETTKGNVTMIDRKE